MTSKLTVKPNRKTRKTNKWGKKTRKHQIQMNFEEASHQKDGCKIMNSNETKS